MTDHTDVMVDLETTGSTPGSGILSIGAVAFRLGQPESSWHCFAAGPIARSSCLAIGLREDQDTLEWWSRQAPKASVLLRDASRPVGPGVARIVEALIDFANWLPNPDILLWGNGADFDNALLASAYRAAALLPPWKFYLSRCYRTMKNMTPVLAPPFQGLKHSALDDALHQTRHLQAILATEKARA